MVAQFQSSQRDWTAIYMKQRPRKCTLLVSAFRRLKHHSFLTAFRTNKQLPVNPRNTSYDFVDRPGETLLDDANEDIVCRWLAEEGIGLPHHRNSDYHRRHRNNARAGLPVLVRKQVRDDGWETSELPARV